MDKLYSDYDAGGGESKNDELGAGAESLTRWQQHARCKLKSEKEPVEDTDRHHDRTYLPLLSPAVHLVIRGVRTNHCRSII